VSFIVLSLSLRNQLLTTTIYFDCGLLTGSHLYGLEFSRCVTFGRDGHTIDARRGWQAEPPILVCEHHLTDHDGINREHLYAGTFNWRA